MPRFAALYNAFLWSMALCILLFQNLWLEMRVNLGVAFFASLVFVIASTAVDLAALALDPRLRQTRS